MNRRRRQPKKLVSAEVEYAALLGLYFATAFLSGLIMRYGVLR